MFHKTPLKPGPLLDERKLGRVHFWLSENWTGYTIGEVKTGPGPLLENQKLDRVHFGGAKNGPGSLLVELNRCHGKMGTPKIGTPVPIIRLKWGPPSP